jgi:hypothetical protein
MPQINWRATSGRTSTAVPTVYQLRAVVHGISPLIWRRLLVPAATSIAELHTVLQTAFGWADEHLHRFVIHGTEYGISRIGTPGFRDDARQVRLGELGLRLGEKFTYTYNYFAGWTCDLRVEQITDTQPGRTYPRCTGGRRAGPPEDWGGAWAFAEQTQPYLVLDAMGEREKPWEAGSVRNSGAFVAVFAGGARMARCLMPLRPPNPAVCQLRVVLVEAL